MTQPPSPVALRQHREQTIARLCDLFARDHLEAHELEQLIDRAHQATSLAELDQLVMDVAADAPLPARTPATPEPAPRTSVYRQQYIVAVMGGAERKGTWRPARQVYVTAVMGGACLDFRRAELDPGITEVYVLALMGGVEIIVPPGTRVESNGIGILGGFAHAGTGRIPVDTSVPVLRVMGLAFMGGVDIREREAPELHRELPREPPGRLPEPKPEGGADA